jgi:hypothetical protein
MMKNILRAGALMLALTLMPLVSVSAHDHGKHKHRRGRKVVVTRTHWNNRNPTPGIPRRVRRGRNWTPGTRRGAFTATTFPRGEGQRLGRVVRRDGDRVGVGKGIGKGNGRGHGKH